MVTFVLFGLLIWRILADGWRSRDAFGTMFAAGLASMILFQLVVNVGMVLGVMPITGIPLPFVTHGGASLVSLAIALGIMQSVNIRQIEGRVVTFVHGRTLRPAAWLADRHLTHALRGADDTVRRCGRRHGPGESRLRGRLFVLFIAAAAAVALMTRRSPLPYSVGLVMLGLLIAAIGPTTPLDVTPELVLIVLVPGLVFEAAYRLRLHRAPPTFLGVAMLAIPGVLVSAAVVAFALSATGLDLSTGVHRRVPSCRRRTRCRSSRRSGAWGPAPPGDPRRGGEPRSTTGRRWCSSRSRSPRLAGGSRRSTPSVWCRSGRSLGSAPARRGPGIGQRPG